MSAGRPVASVIIPAYNSAEYLGAALESVLAQAVDGALEVIVVDDGSTDDTAAVAARIAPQATLIRQANGGVSRARNRALAAATGGVIFFQDSDDLSAPGRIPRCLEHFRAHPGTHLIYGGADFLDPAGQPTLSPTGSSELLPPEFDLTRLFEANFILTGSVAVRAEVVRDVGGFSPRLSAFEDWEYWLRIGCRYRCQALREVLYSYRLRPEGLSSSMSDAEANRNRGALAASMARLLFTARGVPWRDRLRLWAGMAQKALGRARRGRA